MSRRDDFAARFARGEPLTGVFQKFPHHQVTELLGTTGLDFVVLDGEHAPFNPSQVDACMLASKAVDLPLLVRVALAGPEAILAALDMGASGVFVPHVDSAAKAAGIARSARYAGGGRGFSPSTRAGGYGTRGLQPYMDAADHEIVVIAQIEDAAALDCIGEIAGVAGIDGLFVGRADLAASMACDWNDPKLDEATRVIAAAAHQAGVVCGAYLANADLADQYRDWGISFFVVGSDQSALRAEANHLAASMRAGASLKGPME